MASISPSNAVVQTPTLLGAPASTASVPGAAEGSILLVLQQAASAPLASVTSVEAVSIPNSPASTSSPLSNPANGAPAGAPNPAGGTATSSAITSTPNTNTSRTISSSASTSVKAKSTTKCSPTCRPGKSGLAPGAIAGIAVGAVVVVLIAALVGFFLFRRKRKSRWNGGGIGVREEEVVVGSKGNQIQASQPAPAVAGALFKEPPKDDGAMKRLFKSIDTSITNHILNYYVSDSDNYPEELREYDKSTRRDLESHITGLGELVVNSKTRVDALRAVLAGIVMKKFSEGAFFTDVGPFRGPLTAINKGTNSDPYHEARERTVLRLAKIACEDLRYFATTSDEEARRLSLESTVRLLAEFAKEVEKHRSSKWMLLWAETSGKYALFDADTMETADHTPRANHDNSQARVRGVVFPGLRKEWTGKEGQVQSDVLAKAQVLLY